MFIDIKNIAAAIFLFNFQIDVLQYITAIFLVTFWTLCRKLLTLFFISKSDLSKHLFFSHNTFPELTETPFSAFFGQTEHILTWRRKSAKLPRPTLIPPIYLVRGLGSHNFCSLNRNKRQIFENSPKQKETVHGWLAAVLLGDWVLFCGGPLSLSENHPRLVFGVRTSAAGPNLSLSLQRWRLAEVTISGFYSTTGPPFAKML